MSDLMRLKRGGFFARRGGDVFHVQIFKLTRSPTDPNEERVILQFLNPELALAIENQGKGELSQSHKVH